MVGRAGFSLVEAEIALVVFAAGLLAIAAIAARSVGVLRTAEARHSAHVAGVSVIDSLLQVEHPSGGSLVRNRHVIRWVAIDSSATTRLRLYVRYADGTRFLSDSLIATAAAWPRRLSRVP